MRGGTSSTGRKSTRDSPRSSGRGRAVGGACTSPGQPSRPSDADRRDLMSLSTVLFLFLAHLGVGIAFTLVLVSREAGVKFFRFNAGLAAILLAVAFAFRPSGSDAAATSPAAIAALAVCEAALVFYWATIGRMFASIRPAIVWLAIASGTLAIVLQALLLSSDRVVPMQLLTVASFLSSAVLLGGACTAMILGHWYLILPSMQVSHLQSIVKVYII